jgi:hypothetical protein
MPKKFKTVDECIQELNNPKTNNQPAHPTNNPDRLDAFEDLYELMGIAKVQCKAGQLIAR